MQWKRITAVAATVMLAVAACGTPSSNNGKGGANTGNAGTAQEKATDATAKGPAPELDGAKKGGTATVLADVTPDTLDPTNIYFTDTNQIGKLMYRALTQYRLDGDSHKPVLVPDLAEDLGTKSADGLTWTFKLKQGIKYMDGTPVKADDYAYAIKRSFAHDLYDAGPMYQTSTSRTATTTRARTARAATTTPVSRRRTRRPWSSTWRRSSTTCRTTRRSRCSRRSRRPRTPRSLRTEADGHRPVPGRHLHPGYAS